MDIGNQLNRNLKRKEVKRKRKFILVGFPDDLISNEMKSNPSSSSLKIFSNLSKNLPKKEPIVPVKSVQILAPTKSERILFDPKRSAANSFLFVSSEEKNNNGRDDPEDNDKDEIIQDDEENSNNVDNKIKIDRKNLQNQSEKNRFESFSSSKEIKEEIDSKSFVDRSSIRTDKQKIDGIV
ncbi:hypothetical protein QR98_0097140 [Sarcoptes scabiei]|uniref:Uncharacterized protein n=1 Tax=Sarcoptes scabiei TaxID=52283 RepID=A0A132AJI9_SARSC|nr:hypothetical protein QR98_0097140 [Sarcoptes scabiei]